MALRAYDHDVELALSDTIDRWVRGLDATGKGALGPAISASLIAPVSEAAGLGGMLSTSLLGVAGLTAGRGVALGSTAPRLPEMLVAAASGLAAKVRGKLRSKPPSRVKQGAVEVTVRIAEVLGFDPRRPPRPTAPRPLGIDRVLRAAASMERERNDTTRSLSVLAQTTLVERITRECFTQDAAALAPIVAERLDSTRHVEPLLKTLRGERRSTLGDAQWVSIALGRALRAGDDRAAEFVSTRFRTRFTRSGGALTAEVAELLARPHLPAWIERVNQEFRNPLAHGQREGVSAAEYERFCSDAWAAPDIKTYVESGEVAGICSSPDPGWAAALDTARIRRRANTPSLANVARKMGAKARS